MSINSQISSSSSCVTSPAQRVSFYRFEDYPHNWAQAIFRCEASVLEKELTPAILKKICASPNLGLAESVIPLINLLSADRRRELLHPKSNEKHLLITAIDHENIYAVEALVDSLRVEDLRSHLLGGDNPEAVFNYLNRQSHSKYMEVSTVTNALIKHLDPATPLLPNATVKHIDYYIEKGWLPVLRCFFSTKNLQANLSSVGKARKALRCCFSHLLKGRDFAFVKSLIPADVYKEALKPDQAGLSPLFELFYFYSADTEADAIDLIKEMSDETLQAHLTADERGTSLIGYAIQTNSVKILELLFRRLGKEALLAPENQGPGGMSFLSHLARSNSPNAREFFFQQLSPEEILKGFYPDQRQMTAVHYRIMHPHQDLDFWLDFFKKMGPSLLGNTLRACHKQPLYCCAVGSGPAAFAACKTIYEAAGMDPVHQATQPDGLGRTPTMQAILRSNPDSLRRLIDLAGKERIARGLIPNSRASHRVLDRAVTWLGGMNPMMTLLFDLSTYLDDRDFESCVAWKSLTSGLAILQKTLTDRYPSKEKYQQALLRIALADPRWTPDIILHNAFVKNLGTNIGDVSAKTQNLLKGLWNATLLKFLSPKIQNFFMEKEARLQNLEKIKDLSFEERQEKVILEKLRHFGARLNLAFSVNEGRNSSISLWETILRRAADLRDSSLQKKFCELIGLYPLDNPHSVLNFPNKLKRVSSRKSPGLYLLALNALEQRGVNPSLLKGLDLRIQQDRRSSNERHPKGQLLLRVLVDLSLSWQLSVTDINRLLKQLCFDQLMKKSAAISQIISMGEIHRLRSDSLTATIPDFDGIALQCFLNILPITAVEQFATRFQEKFGMRRNSPALFTYTATIAHQTPAIKDLAHVVDSVLRGDYRPTRCSRKNNEHLEAIFKKRPDLEGILPKLTSRRKLVPFTITIGSKKPSCPIDFATLRRKIVDDKHLSKTDFPHLHAFLAADNAAGQQKVLRSLGKVASESSAASKLDQRKVRLQQSLIRLFQLGVSYDRLLSSDAADKGSELPRMGKELAVALGTALSSCWQMRNGGMDINNFLADLEAAESKMQLSKLKGSLDFSIALTDDYWDLFLIGTEVKDSCQNVNSSASTSKALVSYVGDGKTFAIVARKPGRRQTAARRLLRFERIEKTGEVALFLERLYTNYPRDFVDDGIKEMARRVGEELNLPVYYLPDDLETGPVEFHSLTGNMHYNYSDAACMGVMLNEEYRFTAKLLHPAPKNHSATASSSGQVFNG